MESNSWLVRRRLAQTAQRLRETRAKLAVAEEQLSALEEEAEDQGIRSLVSDSPEYGPESRQASAHAASMRRHRDDLRRTLSDLEQRQDALLDKMTGKS